MGAPFCASDHSAAATPQWPAVRKPGAPSWVVTLKPSEQRAPPPKTASPPSTNGLNSPADLLTVAMPEPRSWTVDSSRSHSAPVTVLSAVTWILLVRGSTAQAVPGMVASALSVCAAASISAVLLSTSRTAAPAFFAWTTRSLSSPTTFTTSCRPSAS